jgi:hypothetical protein
MFQSEGYPISFERNAKEVQGDCSVRLGFDHKFFQK